MPAEFPVSRPRRLRRTPALRALRRENQVDINDLIYPLFVIEGNGIKQEISSMPGIHRFSADLLAAEIEEIASLSIPGVIIFGIPAQKDASGTGAYREDGVVQQAVRVIKRTRPELIVATDVCLCEYTDNGHCGVIQGGQVDNDRTLPLLARMAVSYAEAGADLVAPSDMMDGRVGAIRQALDVGGFTQTAIMAYAVKYASAFYGPFREAAQSSPRFGDRLSYQMDPANGREAITEAEQDINEGADIVMVKPALSYLDIVRRVRERFDCPLAAYNVSGEYSMVKAAARQGWLDEKRTVLEILTSIKRAGADIIITYHAKEASGWLKNI